MSDATLRVGLLGCGGFARRYHVPALRDAPQVRTTVICDPNPAVRETAETLGAEIVPNLDDLWSACDAVIVSTPHTLHYAHVSAVLDARRHVLVDKPFVLATAEAEELTGRAKEIGIVAAVAFNRRFDRACLEARARIRAGAIGPIRYVETVQLGYERAGWFLDPALGGGGPYTGRASHMADIIPWLTGARAERVRSRLRFGPPDRSDHGGFIDVVFDTFECRMTCIEEGWHTWDEVRLFGESGMIELRRPLDLPLGWHMIQHGGNGARVEELPADPAPGGATQDFIAAILTGSHPDCGFAEAIDSVRIVAAAFISAREGEAWIDLRSRSDA